MGRLFVFDGETPVPHVWGDTYLLDKRWWGKRILCSTSGDPIELLLEFIGLLEEPYAIVYVLQDTSLTPELQAGRYTLEQVTKEDLVDLLNVYGDFLSQDGRHHFMVNGARDSGSIVYDQHDYFYCYGDLVAFTQVLERHGASAGGSFELGKHGHAIHDERAMLDRLLGAYTWRYGPLEAGDTDRKAFGLRERVAAEARSWWHTIARALRQRR